MATNSFAPVNVNRFTRKWGGTNNTVDPYITGYMFGYFNYIPLTLMKILTAGIGSLGDTGGTGVKSNITDISEVKRILTATLTGVTLPGTTVEKTDFQGLGGVKWSAPTSVSQDNTLSCTFFELSDLPVSSILRAWVKMIRDYRDGLSCLVENDEYHKYNYSSTMYYFTTKPNGTELEYYSCATGMFPTSDPSSLFGHDLATNDKLEITTDFNIDYLFQEKWVYDNCLSILNRMKGDRIVVRNTYPQDDGTKFAG